MLLLALVAGAAAPGEAEEINRVILRVNERMATLYDYEKLKAERIVALTRAQMPEAQRQQLLATAGVSVMKEMFDELLLLSRADQLGLRADQDDVLASIEQTKQGFGITTEEQFEAALASNGMTRESFRSQIEKNLLIRQVMGREVYSEVSLEEEDLRRYYQENPDEFRLPARRRLREVVVLETAQSADARAELAEELRNGMLAGEADALIESWEREGKTTGWIDLGWVDFGDLDAELEASLTDLGPGNVSQPTAARGGLHVIEVVEVEDARLRPFNDVRSDIERKLTDERFATAMDLFMRNLEKNAYIESDPPAEAAGFRSGRDGERTIVDPLEAKLQAAGEATPALTPVADESGGGAAPPE